MIIISPFPKPLRNNKRNPKEYPWWPELIKLLPGEVVQVGIKGEEQMVEDCRFDLPIDTLSRMVAECDLWVAVDNFFQHLAHHLPKPGVVLWGKSDPNIFGYPENLNLLKSRGCLRELQFQLWEMERYEKDVFVKPNIVRMRIQRRWPNLAVVHV